MESRRYSNVLKSERVIWYWKDILIGLSILVLFILMQKTLKSWISITACLILWIVQFFVLSIFSLHILKKRYFLTLYKRISLNRLISEIIKSFFIAIIVLLLIGVFDVMIEFILNGNYQISGREMWIENLPRGLIRTLVIIVGVTIGPISEELFFRGFLYNALKSKISIHVAILLQSLIFAVIHQYSIRGRIDIFLFGIAFALIYEKRKTLLAPIIVHIMTNAIKLIPFLLVEKFY